MKSYLEIHALHSLPPSNVNRDDTGAPKTATYGGALRARVSSQSWKRAIRQDFNKRLGRSEIGVRSTAIVEMLAEEISRQAPDLAERAVDLALKSFQAIGLKSIKVKKDGQIPELGYLLFLSRRQLEVLAEQAVKAAAEPNVDDALKAAKVKSLVDRDHSIDIALFGRMVADAADLNVDAACQVAHALGVHEVTPEFDYYTAVDDRKAESEETGAGMIGTIEFNASTLYRYAVVNLDLLKENLGSSEAAKAAVAQFVRSFIEAVPSGKQNTFANGTRPGAVLITLGKGQPVNLVGAFEEPIRSSSGYILPATERLAHHAAEVFSTWRQPEQILVCGLDQVVGSLLELDGARKVSLEDLVSGSAEASVDALEA